MSRVMIGLVGDVLINRDEPREVFSEVREVLEAPDILFANLESAYTDDPHPVPGAVSEVWAPAHNLDAYVDAGFNVMSLANNHILDVGYEAMLQTRARLRSTGIQTCGAGDCLEDARRPPILEVNGLHIAFLAYASVFPLGYEARANTPGLAPMRAHNVWRDPYPGIHVPGKRPIVTTIPDEADLANLAEDIRNASAVADVVITSFHWGDYSRPFVLTDHETRTARFCIDQGADMVVGHHHHALRGMEWYRGKPIMYGLGHFVFDLRFEWSEAFKKDLTQLLGSSGNPYMTAPREGWPLLPMHEDMRMTVMAWASATREGMEEIGVLPCRLTPDGRVHPLRLDSPESAQVVAYLEKCNQTQRLNGRVTPQGARPIAGFETLRIVPV
jgi:hypothetical protein